MDPPLPPDDAPTGSTFFCGVCKKQVTGTFKYHKRLVHQQATTFSIDDTTTRTTVMRQSGVFRCPFCTTFTHQDPYGLKKHALSCNGDTNTAPPSLNPAQVAPPTAAAPSASPSLSATPIRLVCDGPLDAESFRDPSPMPVDTGLVSSVAPSQALPLLVPISNASYRRVPDPFTVTDSPCDLLPFNIVVSTLLCAVICLECETFVAPDNINRHIRSHNRHIALPPTLQADLVQTFGLTGNVTYPSEMCAPIFGLPLVESPLDFCGHCNRGFAVRASLENHLRGCARSASEGRKKVVGYGQKMPGTSRVIRVDISGLIKASEGELDPLSDIMSAMSIVPDYSTQPIALCDDNLNLKAFFANDGWLEHVQGMTPADLNEARRTHEPDDLYGDCLRGLANHFLEQTQVLLNAKKNVGLEKLLGSVRLENTTEHAFRPIESSDNGTWSSKYKYPEIDPSQLAALQLLDTSIKEWKDDEYTTAMHDAFYEACVALFKHLRHEYPASRCLGPFFSPVICFVVIHCIHEDSSTVNSSTITSVASAIEYAIRGCFLRLASERAKADIADESDALMAYKDYLINQKASVMSFLYNSHALLKTIRGNEYNRDSFWFADPMKTKLTHKTGVITLTGIKELVDGHYATYMDTLRKLAFFGCIPDDIFPDIVIEDLYDDLHRNTVGYSFLTDHRNNLTQYRTRYAKWLLGDEERRRYFTCYVNGRLLWRPKASIQLLEAFSACQLEMAPGLIVSCGPSVRCSEFARLMLFDLSGAPRNVGIVLQHLSINATNDKTSHQRNRDMFIPHIPTREWATALLHYLVIIRPFQTYLAEQLYPNQSDLITRYRHYLWPGITRNMSSNDLREKMKHVTYRYLHSQYTIKAWRSIFTCFSTTFRKPELTQVSAEYYTDIANMHSTTTAVARYGGGILNTFKKDSRDIAGCIAVGIEWQKLVDIGQAKLLYPDESPSTSSNALVAFDSDGIARQIAVRLENHVNQVVKDTIRDRMAEMAVTYFPPPPVPLDAGNLRPVSDVVIHPSRLVDLRKFLRKPDAEFTCPEQAVLLEHLAAKRENILAVLGTSFGKTMLIMMLAKMYGGGRTTVVILPLSTLHADLERRAKEHGLTYAQWTPRTRGCPQVDILSAAVEMLDNALFFLDLQQMENNDRLDRLVFDEVHKLLTDGGYRPVFSHFSKLSALRSPIVGLSGSFPQRLFGPFSQNTGIIWRQIRMPSNRKELRYEIRSAGSDIVKEVIAYTREKVGAYEPHERALIFCRSKNQANSIGASLGVQPFHADSLDTNQQAMADFLQGRQKVLPTTAFLGCGFNYLHIRDVVHASVSHSMIDQYQEDSRGGRDGAMCRAVTFVDPSRTPNSPNDHFDLGFNDLVQWSKKRDQCLRIIPSLYLDGVAVTCLLLTGAVLCAYCEKACSEPAPLCAALLPVATPLSVHTPLSSRPLAAPLVKRPRADSTPERPSKIARADSPDVDPFGMQGIEAGPVACADASASGPSGDTATLPSSPTLVTSSSPTVVRSSSPTVVASNSVLMSSSPTVVASNSVFMSSSPTAVRSSSPTPLPSIDKSFRSADAPVARGFIPANRVLAAPSATLPSTSHAGFGPAYDRALRIQQERHFYDRVSTPLANLCTAWRSLCLYCSTKRIQDSGHPTESCPEGKLAALKGFNFPRSSSICYGCCCPIGTGRSNHDKVTGKGCARGEVLKYMANLYWTGGYERKHGLINDSRVSNPPDFARWLSQVDPSQHSVDPQLSVLRIWSFLIEFGRLLDEEFR
ncbi:unnamed protein product [Cyclocybe aegerita]|uniref:DNA 3'-5' helicase n=1 Tax=Cyclocybe aegerita TaxID=1973307 RepID=A0A8S0XTM9_CYCAE|nr:unnamed protein product [Cyclocybe aegerita]